MPIFLHEIPEDFITSECYSLELVVIPKVSKNGLDVALIHTQVMKMQLCTAGTNEDSIGDSCEYTVLGIAVYTELVVSVLL